MLCPSCKAEIPEGSLVCSKCNIKLSSDSKSIGGLDTEKRFKKKENGSIGQKSTINSEGTLSQPVVQEEDRYETIKFLGEGGMGKVYKAKDKKLDKIVALKRLLKDSKGREKGLARFLKEAQAIAKLNHYNIVNIYDIGEDKEGHFIVMEYIEGETLSTRIKGKLSIEETIDLAQQIGRALSYAHRQSPAIIHRDIKPSNILITKEDVPKIVDFGLAQIERESELSKSGYGMGTIDYMAPEQRRDAKNIDHRADIYAFGATLYEMVTGEKPKTIRESRIPEQLRHIILKALEEKPENRYFSIDELLREMVQKDKPKKPGVIPEEGACLNCGFVNPKEVKYCKECGAGLFEKCPNPKCGHEDRVGIKFCGLCGTNIEQFKQIQNYLTTAKEYYANYNYSRAIKELEKALQLAPNFEEAQKLLKEVKEKFEALDQNKSKIQSLFDEEKFEEAEVELKAALVLAPNDEELVLKLNEIPHRIQDRDFKLCIKKAKKYTENGQFEKAAEECKNALNIKSDNQEAEELLNQSQEKIIEKMISSASELNNNYQWQEALALITKIENLAPENSLAKLLREEIETKISHIKNLMEQAKDSFVAYKYEKVIEVCKRITEINPQYKEAQEFSKKSEEAINRIQEHFKRGQKLYDEFNYEAAIKEWSKIQKLNPADDKAALLIKETEVKIDKLNQHLAEARKAFNSCDFENVISECEQAIRIKPTEEEAIVLSKKAKDTLERITQLKSNAKSSIDKREFKNTLNYLYRILKLNPAEYETKEMIIATKASLKKIRARKLKISVLSFTTITCIFLITFFTLVAIKNKKGVHIIKEHISKQEYDIALDKLKQKEKEKFSTFMVGENTLKALFVQAYLGNTKLSVLNKNFYKAAHSLKEALILKPSLRKEITQQFLPTKEEMKAEAVIYDKDSRYHRSIVIYEALDLLNLSSQEKHEISDLLELAKKNEKTLSDDLEEEKKNVGKAKQKVSSLNGDKAAPLLWKKALELQTKAEEEVKAGEYSWAIQSYKSVSNGFNRIYEIAKEYEDMVYIPSGEFFMDKYEVTNKRYNEFVKATGYQASKYRFEYDFNADSQPVVGVSWDDAVAFCKWKGKRLPKEAEWEKAARGGLEGKKYPWGDEIGKSKANYNSNKTMPVGSYEPNGYGLYDMVGNVMEWTEDWYDAGTNRFRVLRGGSWDQDAADLVVTSRTYNSPDTRTKYIGFRCVKDVYKEAE